MKIPQINLGKSDSVKKLNTAFTDYGFVIVNKYEHITKDLIKDAYKEAEGFFNLSQKEKDKYKRDDGSGYFPFGVEHAKDTQEPDLKEFFHIYYKNINQFKGLSFPRIKELINQLNTLSEILLKLTSEALGAYSKTELANAVVGGQSILRLINYPELTEDPKDAIRASAHEDINLITLLVSATNPGLELRVHGGEWVGVDCGFGDIIVNVGDMLQSYTNGYYKSATHRVTNATKERRLSMPYFVHPRSGFNIGPRLDMIEKTGGGPKFPKLTQEEYLNIRLKEIGLKN